MRPSSTARRPSSEQRSGKSSGDRATSRPSAEGDTRARLLEAALLLFRQRGFHGVAVSDVLLAAGAPKGCLYHHFPGGKEQMAVAVIEEVAAQVVALLAADPQTSAAQALCRFGDRLQRWMRSTSRAPGPGACALIASFAAAADTAPSVAAAAKIAYQQIAGVLTQRLQVDGFEPPQAQRTALLVIATIEGGGLVSQALGDSTLFSAALERAVALCEVTPKPEVRS